jgi:GT2 family glycosyltransferase
MKKVLISFPNTGWIHKLVFMVGVKLLSDRRYDSKIIVPTHNPYENNLHHIVNDFVAGGYDYWLNIDADNPPMNNPLDLIELDKDIIGCPTPVYHFTDKVKGERPWYENAYKYSPRDDAYLEWPNKVGLQRVDAVGTGCMLMARRVFDHPEMRKGAFTRKLNPDGTVDRGNDISFCERARENGFKIWAHYDYRCQHFNELEMHEVIRAFHGVYTKE